MISKRRQIPKNLADQLVEEADLLLILAERHLLTRRGKNYQGDCPFCRLPNFLVSEEKRFYHCFDCKKSGTALTYLMEAQNMELVDAIEFLSMMQGVDAYNELPQLNETGRNRHD